MGEELMSKMRGHSWDIQSVLLQEEYLIVQAAVNHTSGSVWLLKTTLFNSNIAALLQTTVYLGLGPLLWNHCLLNIHQSRHLTSPDNSLSNHPAWLNGPDVYHQSV